MSSLFFLFLSFYFAISFFRIFFLGEKHHYEGILLLVFFFSCFDTGSLSTCSSTLYNPIKMKIRK